MGLRVVLGFMGEEGDNVEVRIGVGVFGVHGGL